jgi:hypothetical protein
MLIKKLLPQSSTLTSTFNANRPEASFRKGLQATLLCADKPAVVATDAIIPRRRHRYRCNDYGSKGRAIREGGEIVSSGVKVFVKVVKLFVKVWKLFCESPETFRKLLGVAKGGCSTINANS